MDLPSAISSIRDLTDLPRFVGWLGQRPHWQELAADTLPVAVERAAEVGSAGDLVWLGIQSPHPASDAGRLSARLAARKVGAAVLAIDPARRELAIAVALERPVVMACPLDGPEPEERERLRRLAQARGSGLRLVQSLAEALGAEPVGHRFFRAFARETDRMAEALAGPLRTSDRRELALLQLTRVLFLYFVQCRGWLDGRPDFLRQMVDAGLGRGRRIHRDLFRPLFFGTLNRAPEARGRALAFGRIPFLNGGLFEPHSLERRWRGEIPNESWRSAFDNLFERFHFTIHESEGPDGVAPDMLGRVFERLMAPEARRATGAFYTPARLVSDLIDAALAAFIAERFHLPREAGWLLLASPSPGVRALLGRSTLLDPACGSGAFLVGALERLATLAPRHLPPARVRRAILARNLFGVDLNPMAVRLTELRLWLAVLAAEPPGEPEQVDPLPNLDGVVRQGDSLLEPGWVRARLGVRPGAGATELAHLRAEAVGASGMAKREALRTLRRAEIRLYREGLREAETVADSRIMECLTSARAVDLFGRPRGLDRALRRSLCQARHDRADLRRLRRRLDREGELGWFSFDGQWADVMARGGFDIVIGNPPWVRSEDLPRSVRQQLSGRFRWWRAEGATGFQHQGDLSLAFLERGLELAAPRGVVAFLMPAKLTTAAWGRRARASLSRERTIHVVADLADSAAAFQATVYPTAIVLGSPAPPPGHHPVHGLAPGAGPGPPQARLGSAPWIVHAPALLDAVEAATADHPRLGQVLPLQLGVKTGANAVFLNPPSQVESSLVRWAIRGRDLRPFRTMPRCRLLWTHDGTGRPLPRLAGGALAHLRPHRALLEARVDFRGGPWWTLFRTEAAVAPCRVVWSDLSRRLTAVPLVGADASNRIPLNTCYVTGVETEARALALAAWLNATWIRAIARAGADVAAGGFARFGARALTDVPLPRAILDDPGLAALGRAGVAGTLQQEELDGYVARCLALSPAAREALAGVSGVRDTADRGRAAPVGG